MILLTAYVSLLPDKVASALEACRTVKSHSIKEPGCERYDFFQSTENPAKLVFVEEWSTRADLDVHFQQAAFQDFFSEIAEYLTGPPEIRIFQASLLE